MTKMSDLRTEMKKIFALTIILCVAVDSCRAITTRRGARPYIPIHGWRDSAESAGSENFDRNEYRNYRRNPVTFFDRQGDEANQNSGANYGGRGVRNTGDYPKPQLPWEEALRHSVYLTLVRDRIDAILINNIGNNRQHLEIDERTKGDDDVSDVNLWHNIRKATFKQNSKEKGPVFGDIAILSRGKLVETPQGYEFIEDEDVKECIECHLYSARPNEVEAEKILTSACEGPDCRSQRIKALWTVRRIRHRNPEADDPPFMYELMFSVASPKHDRTKLDYNEPSQTFSIKEVDKAPKPPKKHERKGKLIFLDEKSQDYKRGGFHSPQGAVTEQGYDDVRTESPSWYDKFTDSVREKQLTTEPPKYLKRYPEFYPEYQGDPRTRLNTGEKYANRQEGFRFMKPPYAGDVHQQKENVQHQGHTKINNPNSEELTSVENIKYYKPKKNYDHPTITHLHHHYYLNDKGQPVMKPSIKFEQHNNYETYLPNMYKGTLSGSDQNLPFPQDGNIDYNKNTETLDINLGNNRDKSNIYAIPTPRENEIPVTIPFFTTDIASPTEKTMQYEVVTLSNNENVTDIDPNRQFYRTPVKYETTQRKTRRRKLRPTKPFRPSPVDERIVYSERDPFYIPTISTPTSYTTDAQLQVINIKKPTIEENTSDGYSEASYGEDSGETSQGSAEASSEGQDESSLDGLTEINLDEQSEINLDVQSEINLDEQSKINLEGHSEESPEENSGDKFEKVTKENSKETSNEHSEPLRIPIKIDEETFTVKGVTEKPILSFEVGTTIENIYVPEYSDSDENLMHALDKSFEKEIMETNVTTPTIHLENKNEEISNKTNSHRLERKPYKPNRRVKLQKKFSELIKSQLPSPRNTGTTVPYSTSVVTAVYAEKIDSDSEFEKNTTQLSLIPTSPTRKLRQRNNTSTFVPPNISRRKYQRKIGTWSSNLLRRKLSTEKSTSDTTEGTNQVMEDKNNITTVDDMKIFLSQNVTLIKGNEQIMHNETAKHLANGDPENSNKTNDSEINASNPVVATINISEENATEYPFELTKLSNSEEYDSTETNESTEPTTMSEITELTTDSEIAETIGYSESDNLTLSDSTESHTQTTDASSKSFSVSDEEIFTPLTKKSFVTSISLKLGNKTRPYYQSSTELPENGTIEFIDRLKVMENNTFMADLLSRFKVDTAMKAKISEVNGAGKFKMYKAEDPIEVQGVKGDSIAKEILEHAKSVK